MAVPANMFVRMDLATLQSELERLALESGTIARATRSELHRDLKADGSLVTAADKRIELMLSDELNRLMPDVSFWGEEGGFQERGTEGVWLIDPIDGTSNYAFGSPLWGISIALVQGGEIVAGAIHLPDLQELYSFHHQGPAIRNGMPLLPIRPGPIEPWELVSYSDLTLLEFGKQLPGKMRYCGAFVVEAAYVFRQCFRGLISHKANLYDAAASIGIAKALGAEIRYLDGDPFYVDPLIEARRIPKPFVIFPAGEGTILP